MARRTTRTTRRTRRTKKSRYTQVEKTAYLMGQVERGLKNPNSRITASYENGSREPNKRVKKPLF